MTEIETAVRPKVRFFDAKGCSAYVNGVKTARWFADEARAGRLRHHKFGKTIAVAEPDLDEFIAANLCDAYGRKPR